MQCHRGPTRSSCSLRRFYKTSWRATWAPETLCLALGVPQPKIAAAGPGVVAFVAAVGAVPLDDIGGVSPGAHD